MLRDNQHILGVFVESWKKMLLAFAMGMHQRLGGPDGTQVTGTLPIQFPLESQKLGARQPCQSNLKSVLVATGAYRGWKGDRTCCGGILGVSPEPQPDRGDCILLLGSSVASST